MGVSLAGCASDDPPPRTIVGVWQEQSPYSGFMQFDLFGGLKGGTSTTALQPAGTYTLEEDGDLTMMSAPATPEVRVHLTWTDDNHIALVTSPAYPALRLTRVRSD